MCLRQELRPIGFGVNQLVPAGGTLNLPDHDYEPALFYVQRPCTFAKTARELSPAAKYVLVQNDELEDARKVYRDRFDEIHLPSKGKKQFFLLKRPEGQSKGQPQKLGK